MGELSSWSLSLGRWHTVTVRLHVFFFLFAVQALYIASRATEQGMVVFAVACIFILLGSVLLHEIGHCWAAARVGGHAEQIVLWPLGGLIPPYVPPDPQLELVTALAGPVVNMVLMLLAAPPLLASGQDLLGLFVPLAPAALTEGPAWIVGFKLVFWINWLLVLVNLLPAFPFDTGRMLRCLLWSQFDYRTAVYWVTRSAMVTAVGMCGVAWWLRDSYPTALVPAWVPLVLFAIFLFFGAQQEEARLEQGSLEDDFYSYDFSQGYTSLERDMNRNRAAGPGPIRRWLATRRIERRRKQQALERDEEQQVDAILARLHDTGISALTSQERALLERVSARYRNRQQS
jgi:stage IV sporulation protein FB